MIVGGVDINIVRDNLTLRVTASSGKDVVEDASSLYYLLKNKEGVPKILYTDESSLCKRFSNDLGTVYLVLNGIFYMVVQIRVGNNFIKIFVTDDMDYDIVVLKADGEVCWTDAVPDIINVHSVVARDSNTF